MGRGRHDDLRRGAGQAPRVRAPRRAPDLHRPHLLVAQRQHLPRSPLGPRPGDLRRRPLPDRAHGRGLRQGPAGRRSALPQTGGDAQALRRAQRAGTRPPSLRRAGERARPAGDLPAGVRGLREGGRRRLGDGRVQPHQRRALLRQPDAAWNRSCATSGASTATWSPTAGRSTISSAGTVSSKTPAEAAALAVKAGCDLECGCAYAALLEAVGQGLIDEATLDRSLVRLFTARMRLGMFDPAEQVPYADIPFEVNDAPAHRALAREAAQKAICAAQERGRAAAAAEGPRLHRGHRAERRRPGGAAGQLQRHAVTGRHAAGRHPPGRVAGDHGVHRARLRDRGRRAAAGADPVGLPARIG